MSSLRPRTLPAGFIPPCLPTAAPSAPSGDQWWHEIKHDGIRVIARKEDKRVRLFSRPGNDLTDRFPLIVEALGRLRARSCILDGEAVACGDDGIALFELIRRWRNGGTAFMYAFDLIELNGDDLRREQLERRKAALARLLARAGQGVQLNEHLEAEGPLVFEHACRMGLEGIVSKRRASWYSSGRSRDWVKAKNPRAPAVTRLAEEDWGRSWSSSGSGRPSPRSR
jgi:bifunctional non-homologous end joining protein LigD